MKVLSSVVVVLVSLSSQANAQQCKSVLSNIDCGGGQATCTQLSSGVSGAVRCTCTAQCLSPSSITTGVAATRQLQWGTYVPGSGACSVTVTGNAYGRTEAPPNSGTVSAVNAQVTVSGQGIVVNSTSSVQTVDCFQGTVENDANISGACISYN